MKTQTSAPPDNPKHLILPIGSRGGVGKTFLIALLWSWLLTKLIRCRAVDLDTENSARGRGGLRHFVPGAQLIDLHTPAGLDLLLDTLQGPEQVIIGDMPAANGHQTLPWFEEMHPFLHELNVQCIFLCLITDFVGTVDGTLTWADSLQDQVRYVSVLNPLGDPQADFMYWKNAEEVHAFKAAFLPAEIILPSIRSDIMPHLEENGLTLHSAAEAASLPAPLDRFSTRCRLRTWRDQVFQQFDSIQSILLP